MPDFEVRYKAGTTVEPWLDPARPPLTEGPSDPGAPSRLNPRPGIPHKRLVVHVGVAVDLWAYVEGLGEGPADTDLGGRLFYSWAVEWNGAVPSMSEPSAGYSSKRRWIPDASQIGHVTLGFGRHGGGGAVLLHFDVES